MGRGGNTGKSRARESSTFQALAPCGGEDVDDLDAGGKCHGEIDVAARDMEADAVRDQRHADEQQERQRKHLGRGMALHETGNRSRGEIHGDHRDDDGGHHDLDVLGHADGGHDGIDGKYEVDEDDLNDHAGKGGACLAALLFMTALDALVDFVRALHQQEKPAGEQDQVPPRERLAEEREHRRRETDQNGEDRQERDAKHKRQSQADLAGAFGACRVETADQHRDEDHVVDAEHDLHDRQREQACPCGRILKKLEHRVASVPVAVVSVGKSPRGPAGPPKREAGRCWIRPEATSRCPRRTARWQWQDRRPRTTPA